MADQCGGCPGFHHGETPGVQIEPGNIQCGKGLLGRFGQQQPVHHADSRCAGDAAADKLAEQLCGHPGLDGSIFSGSHAVGQHQIGVAGAVSEEDGSVTGDGLLAGVPGGGEVFQPVSGTLAEPIAHSLAGVDGVQFFQRQIQRFGQDVPDGGQTAVQFPALTAHLDHKPVGKGVVHCGGVAGITVVEQLAAHGLTEFAAVADVQLIAGGGEQVLCGCQLFQENRAALGSACRQKACLAPVGGVTGKEGAQAFCPNAVFQLLRNCRRCGTQMGLHFPKAGEGVLVVGLPAAQLVPAAAADRLADFPCGVACGFFLGQDRRDGIRILPDAADGVCHILQPGRKGQRVIRAVGQVCDKPLVQPAAVQEQKGCAAQKQVDDSGDLEQTCPEGDERHQREQEKYTGNEKSVFSGEIAHQQTAHRQDQHGKSGIRCAQDCAAGCQCAADYAAGTPELLCPD